MAEYKINTRAEKAILENFGLEKVKTDAYYKPKEAQRKAGLQVPAALGAQVALNQIYKPGVNINQQFESLYKETQEDLFDANAGIRPFLSYAGSQVFSYLKFGDMGDNVMVYPVDTCLFNVTQTKNIVKTQISGRKGTIKEYIGEGDYSIQIRGMIQGRNGIYPLREVKNLYEFLTLPSELPIESPYLNDIFDIKYVVVESFDFPQNEASISQQFFTINCSSDKPFDIISQ